MKADPALIQELEAVAFESWPAAEVETLGGWRLRHTPPGITRRANSIWAGEEAEGFDLDERIAAALRFYAERNAQAVVQITPASRPASLDAELAERGWSHEAAVSIQVAPSEPVTAACTAPEGVALGLNERFDPDWFALAAERSRFAEAPEAYRALLMRIGAAAGCVLVRREGRPVAMGLGVVGGAWLGVFSMFTVPEERGSGLARAVLGGLARFARERGVARLYLQVERDNPAALALYRRAGFGELYGYHYRRAPASR